MQCTSTVKGMLAGIHEYDHIHIAKILRLSILFEQVYAG